MTPPVPKRLGSYLKREVRCGAVDDVEDLRGLVMHDSLVLIDTGDGRVTAEEQSGIVEQIVKLRPLGVVFTGAAGEMMFDRLLDALDTPTNPLPIMTSFSSDALPQAVAEFLSSTWPAEGHWDEWQAYLLISIGGSIRGLEEAATPMLVADGQR